MANPKIEVEIGANLAGLEKGVAESGKILSGVGKSANGASSGLENLSRSNTKVNNSALQLSQLVKSLPNGFDAVGREVVDLGNSFNDLTLDANKGGASLGAALSSLITPANLVVLGITAAFTAFTLYKQGAFDAKDKTKELKEELERLNQASKDYLISLTSLNRAQLSGRQDAASELTTLKTVFNATQDTTLSIETRRKAVAKLQELYPKVFKNFSSEIILAGQATTAYNNLSNSIIATARAEASRDTIVDNEKKLIALENERESLIEKIAKSEAFIDQKLKDQSVSFGNIKNISQQLADSETRLLEPIYKRRAELSKEINKLSKDNLGLQKNITDQIKAGATTLELNKDVVVETVKEADKLKRVFEDISKLSIGLPRSGDADALRNAFEGRRGGGEVQLTPQERLNQAVSNAPGVIINTDNIQSQIKALDALKEALAGTSITVEQFYAAIANGAAEGFNSLGEFVSELSKTQEFINGAFAVIEQGIENTIGDIAFAVGDALASGGNVLKAGGAALLGGLATVLNQLGQMAIATGITIKGIKVALETLNPVVAVAAGVALIALAGFVSNKSKSLGGAIGGGGGGGGSVGSSVSGQTFSGSGISDFNPNRELFGELVVRGNDLVYVLGETRTKIAKG